ncbi:hypothetical protein TNCV_1354161 [Trichonephila clavipes]|nr:hypothetical protein TNCV_1354161 [Trichonephila clavipes]
MSLVHFDSGCRAEVSTPRQSSSHDGGSKGKFCNARKGSNRLVPDPDYIVEALKLPNQAPRVPGESLKTCVTWRCPDGTQHLFCWPIVAVSGQSLASNGPVFDSRDLNLVIGHTEQLIINY